MNLPARVLIAGYLLFVFSGTCIAVTISTSSCIPSGRKYLEEGSSCYYTCKITGLGSGSYHSYGIMRYNVTSYGIKTFWSLTTPFAIYNSTAGLAEGYEDTGRYKVVTHSQDQGATINIERMVSEDSAVLACFIFNEAGEIQLKAGFIRFSVKGAKVTTSLGFWNQTEQEFNEIDSADVTIDKANISLLAFAVDVDGVMPSPPNMSVAVKYDNGFTLDKSACFTEFSLGHINMTDGLPGFSLREVFHSPSCTLFDTDKGKPTIAGTFTYTDTNITEAKTVDLLFEPRMISGKKDHYVELHAKLTAEFLIATNPALSTMAVKINGVIHDGSDAKVTLAVSPAKTAWQYVVSVHYKDATEDIFGRNELIVTNQQGNITYGYEIYKGRDPNSAAFARMTWMSIIPLLLLLILY